MRPPEMTYSPAYQDQQAGGPLLASPAPPPPPPPPTARRSLDHPSVSGGVLCQSSDSFDGHNASPSTRSHILDRSHAVSARPGTTSASIGTRTSVSSTTHKEARTRTGSADQPSMSSGLGSPGAARGPKRSTPEDDASTDDGEDALLMLFRLSLPVPIFSLAAFLYTISAIVFAVLISPLRLCPVSHYLSTTSFASQLCDLLSPALHIHERLVNLGPPSNTARSPSTQWIPENPDPEPRGTVALSPDSHEYYSVTGLMIVLMLSVFGCLAILLSVWTAAFFWIFAMMLGNPDGTERSDDGRAAVLGVCKWWQTWLGKARKSHN
ncbi:hypothetical protein N7474_011071 [Penicillium riverlandense]|uniref:uncharacterized protein n=1 Tax=Penicillium riverlandense TaxID=1903569 RepID=UPI00254883E3|nr:uncharacterized protein N7474_011071 [Penicillium riverlandense]KAJ5805184.1 hypothetical protein N7474_011071 [Penicillium riverlandense]